MKPLDRNRRRAGVIITVALAATIAVIVAALSSCSVVFTAGINGRVVDAETFAEDSTTGGVNGVRVYLYIRDRPRQRDIDRMETDGLLPDEDGGDEFYLETVTDVIGGDAGAFSFPTIYWNDLLPAYGRSGDRRDIYLLLYHPEYGLVEHTASIVSDTTNTLAPVELLSLFEEATVSGRVERAGSSSGVAGVTVSAYVAEGWVDGTGFSYPSQPGEEATTGATGNYSIDLTFPRELVSSAGGGGALLTFSAEDYEASVAVDADLSDSRDVDGDGTADVTYETPVLTAGENTEIATISIKQVSFTETLDGRVGVDSDADGNIDTGTNGAVVALYINRSVPPGAADPPDLTTTTSNRIVDTNVEAGWFSFPEVSWEDDLYTGSQSSIACYLDVDANADGTVDVDNRLVVVYSNTDNTVQIVP